MAGNLTAMIASIFSGSAVTADPYYEYTTLLLPGNGTNGAQNNTFLDGSTNNFTITRNGNTTQGTFSPFSQTGWGNYFNGSSTLDTSNAAFNPAGAFTIEFWFYGTDSATATQGLVSTWASGLSPAQGILIWKTGANCEIQIGNASTGGTTIATFTWATYLNQWNHFALVRNSSNSCAVFLNGTRLAAPVTKSGSPGQTALTIGRAFPNSASSYFTGYMSNVSFVSGSNVYDPASSTITVPTTPLSTSTTNQALLTCQANRFIDSNTATTAKTITLTGSPSVQAFSPFNPTASWSAATYGGSGYFDGSGDSLSVASNTALQLTGEFTMEAWYYPLGFPGSGLYDCLLTTGDNSLSNAIAIYINSSGGIQLYNHVTNAAIFNTASGVVLNAWNHIAATRKSSNGVDLWLNGVSQGSTVTVSSSFTSTTPTRIGTSNTNQDCYGYISNVRIVKGVAVYTSAFTPPTAPLTAITNTSLLLNFTNAGVYDATSKNDLETVGNAQISTTQSKWGGSSMYFDGTGDYVTSYNANALFRIGNIYTIELWFYTTTIAAGSAGLICLAIGASTNSGINIYRSGSEIICNDGATGGTGPSSGSSAITTNTWTHLAVVSDGTTTKMYIDGVLKGTYSGTTASSAALTYVTVGANGDKSAVLNGYIQDVRITKGIARYTANFTPPTAAFPTL
jgi:hypothetical protein